MAAQGGESASLGVRRRQGRAGAGGANDGGRSDAHHSEPVRYLSRTNVHFWNYRLDFSEAIDDDVLRCITSLGCFKEKEKLVESLMDSTHNTGRDSFMKTFLTHSQLK